MINGGILTLKCDHSCLGIKVSRIGYAWINSYSKSHLCVGIQYSAVHLWRDGCYIADCVFLFFYICICSCGFCCGLRCRNNGCGCFYSCCNLLCLYDLFGFLGEFLICICLYCCLGFYCCCLVLFGCFCCCFFLGWKFFAVSFCCCFL